MQAGHGTQSHSPAGGNLGIPAFPGSQKKGNVLQELRFWAQVGIPAGLFMDTARLGGAQDLGNVGLAPLKRLFKDTLEWIVG